MSQLSVALSAVVALPFRLAVSERRRTLFCSDTERTLSPHQSRLDLLRVFLRVFLITGCTARATHAAADVLFGRPFAFGCLGSLGFSFCLFCPSSSLDLTEPGKDLNLFNGRGEHPFRKEKEFIYRIATPSFSCPLQGPLLLFPLLLHPHGLRLRQLLFFLLLLLLLLLLPHFGVCQG